MSEVLIEEKGPDGISYFYESVEDKEIFLWEFKKWICECGKDVVLFWDDISYGGYTDITCECGQMYNTHGTRVTKSLREIDPADAGEEW